jgi:hypothetical protein
MPGEDNQKNTFMTVEQSSLDNQEMNRPRILSVLVIFIFLAALFQVYKFIQVLLQWSKLTELPLTVSPIYLAGSGIIWGLSGLVLSWGLWTGRSWSRKTGLVLSLAYAAFIWVDMTLIAEPDILKNRWLINLFYTILGLTSTWLVLNLTKTRNYISSKPH